MSFRAGAGRAAKSDPNRPGGPARLHADREIGACLPPHLCPSRRLSACHTRHHADAGKTPQRRHAANGAASRYDHAICADVMRHRTPVKHHVGHKTPCAPVVIVASVQTSSRRSPNGLPPLIPSGHGRHCRPAHRGAVEGLSRGSGPAEPRIRLDRTGRRRARIGGVFGGGCMGRIAGASARGPQCHRIR